MAGGVCLTFFGSFVFGTPGFPLQTCRFKTSPIRWPKAASKRSPRVFSLEQIWEAHGVMEANEAGGKMVVVLA
jgi:NADPH2:quinone reductase